MAARIPAAVSHASADTSAPPAPPLPVLPLPPSEPGWHVDRPGSPESADAGPPAAARRDVRTAGDSRAGTPREVPGPGPSARDAERVARRLLTLVLEVVDGRRAPARLERVLAPGVHLQVTRLAAARGAEARDGARGAPRHPSALRTVTVAVSPPVTAEAHASVVEVCATYTRGRRMRAMAARIALAPGEPARCLALRMPA